MAFIRPSIDTIYSRIKADIETRVTGNVKIPEKSLLDILTRVFAGAIHLCYGVLVWLSDQFFTDTQDLEFLEREAILLGFPRKPAEFATGDSTFKATNGTFIDVGIEIQDEQGVVYFTTSSDFVTDDIVDPGIGAVTVDVQAKVAGTGGNFEGGAMSLVDPNANPDIISDEVITQPIENGVDAETEDALRERITILKQQPPSGGKEQDYLLWALEIPGVDKAWVYDIYLGAGTVGVVIADEDFQPVATSIKEDTQDNINAKGPLGVKKDVIDPDSQPVTWSIKIVPNTPSIQQNVENNMLALFDSITRPGGTILLSQMRNAIANSGVNDYEITDIEFGSYGSIGVANIEASNFELPYPDSYTFTTLT